MRKTVGFLIVLLFANLAIVATSTADQTSISHVAHLSAAHGPQITCTTSCHVDPYAGLFLDGQDLANTDVCDTCHSDEGAFDGVAMAKANWHTGVYSGKEIVRNYQRHYRLFNSEGG